MAKNTITSYFASKYSAEHSLDTPVIATVTHKDIQMGGCTLYSNFLLLVRLSLTLLCHLLVNTWLGLDMRSNDLLGLG